MSQEGFPTRPYIEVGRELSVEDSLARKQWLGEFWRTHCDPKEVPKPLGYVNQGVAYRPRTNNTRKTHKHSWVDRTGFLPVPPNRDFYEIDDDLFKRQHTHPYENNATRHWRDTETLRM